MKKSKWLQEQKILLRQLQNKFTSKKWKQISKELKKNGFQRTQVQCRQKWVNQLNPNLCKGIWTQQQLSIIFQNFAQSGSHWSIIEKRLQGRTQNMIKNKFYSLLRNIVRFILRVFRQNAQSTKRILNKLSTKTLQDIYCGQNQFQFMGNLLMERFEFMDYQINRNAFKKIIEREYSIFQRLYRIIMQFNTLQKSNQEIDNNIKIQQDIQKQEQQVDIVQKNKSNNDQKQCKLQQNQQYLIKRQKQYNQFGMNNHNNYVYCYPYPMPENLIDPNYGMINPNIYFGNIKPS